MWEILTARVRFHHTAARRRLAAAGRVRRLVKRFNTQPPEGGWTFVTYAGYLIALFQHTAARRRLRFGRGAVRQSRGFNTQPPEGGWIRCLKTVMGHPVSTHSRPKAAANRSFLSTNKNVFQHTAARRRLLMPRLVDLVAPVSTHSRPKAAANTYECRKQPCAVSTHSRPKAAGKDGLIQPITKCAPFQHTAARRRLHYHASQTCPV